MLDPLTVLLLDPGPVAEPAAVVVEALGEVVSQHLELAQRQDARAAAGGDPPLEPLARIRGAEESGEVGLEPGDLVEQRAPCGALVLDDDRR